jgi:hypothetical protein
LFAPVASCLPLASSLPTSLWRHNTIDGASVEGGSFSTLAKEKLQIANNKTKYVATEHLPISTKIQTKNNTYYYVQYERPILKQ